MDTFQDRILEKLTPRTYSNEKPYRAVMVRMTPSLHEALKKLAAEQMTSLNKLCVAAFEVLTEPSPVDTRGGDA